MYEFLDPGGILINIDLFNYKDKLISKYAHDFDIDYIRKQFDNPDPEFIEGARLTQELRVDLKRKWVDHMNKDNLLDPVETHLEILRGLGFSAVECVFRCFQQGVIVAIK